MSLSNAKASTPAYTDFNALAALRSQARQRDPGALDQVARHFEAVFLSMMLKSMRDATPESGLFGGSSMKLYQGMLDQQLSQSLSGSAQTGIAELLVRQLGQSPQDPAPAPAGGGERELRLPPVLHTPRRAAPGRAAAAGHAAPAAADTGPGGSAPSRVDWHALTGPEPFTLRPRDAVPEQSATSPAGAVRADEPFDGPDDFVTRLLPYARRAAGRLGVAPEALIAQAALETGWGRHLPGGDSNNLFGIKADQRWNGERVATRTMEVTDGVMHRVRAEFRAYQDYAASFDDYADFLQSNPRYEPALAAASDPEAYVHALQDAGYATDPAYARKVLSILERDPLAGLKSGLLASL